MTPSWPKLDSSIHYQLGVINLTPNSFSDGGKHSTHQVVTESLAKWARVKNSILDLGAESTAPMNQSINAQEELKRFDELVFAGDIPWQELERVSVDTYKPQVMDAVYQRLVSLNPNLFILWNDISGKLDDPFYKLMNKYPKLHYILCHNLAPERSLSGRHRDFCQELSKQDFIDHLLKWFDEQIEALKKAGLMGRVIIDPCFGFSKTPIQNEWLWQWLLEQDQLWPEFPLVIGISRKSFLRGMLFAKFPEYEKLEKEQLNDKLDSFQQQLLDQLKNRSKRGFLFRVHRPLVL